MKSKITGYSSIKINTPSSKVWEALTEPAIIKKYFFGTETKTDWKPGSPISFEGEYEGKAYKDKGTIIDFRPISLLKYSYWSSMSPLPDKPENYMMVTFELTPDNDATLLKVTQENIPDEKTKEHSEQNWNKVLATMKDLLEQESVASL